jgi:1-phosphofructokinase
MIVTLTANPSLDRTVRVAGALTPGGVHRIVSERLGPGGKGINVALGAAGAGLVALAVFPADEGDPLRGLVDRSGLRYRATPLGGPVRTNLAVLSDPEVTTKINEPGPTLTPEKVAALEEALADVVSEGDTAMLSGSLAPGIPADEYARLVRSLRARGVWVGVDTSDAPLAALAEDGRESAPDFLKPNAEELGQLTGVDGAALEARARAGDLDGVRDAVGRLREAGVADVLVTLGGAGAVLATEEGCWYAPSPDAPVVSTVGAGDSAVAGYLIARAQGDDGPGRLALAVAYGAVAVSLPGTTIPARDQVLADTSAVRPL